MTTDTGKCGTDAGFQRHYRRKEQACEPCRQARADKQKARKLSASPSDREKSKALDRARTKALTRLSKKFPADYLELLTEEAEKEGLDTSRIQTRAWKAAVKAAAEQS